MSHLMFHALASSSGGNVYLVENDRDRLLLECGVTYKRLGQLTGHTISQLTACLITHEHKDHSQAAAMLLRHGVAVYMSEGTARELDMPEADIVEPLQPFRLGTFRVMAFPVWHDAREPVGYLVDDTVSHDRLLFAADTNGLNIVVPRLTHVAVECNYSDDLLAGQVHIPDSLKERIRHNHFEVEDVVRWLHKQDLSTVREINLLHLSSANSREAAWRARFFREFPGIEIKICKA